MDKESEQANLAGLEAAEATLQVDPSFGYARSFVAYFHARLRHRQLAQTEIAQALKSSTDGYDVLWMAVLTYEALGGLDQRQAALDALSSAPAQLVWDLNRWPDLAGLQKDPRFVQLLVSNHVQ